MTTNKTPRIAVIGSNMVDLVTYVNRMPVRGETVEAPSFEMGHGGKGANQAVAAAKLGAAVVMVTKVGDDMFADNTIRNLASFGVDTKHARRVSGPIQRRRADHGRTFGRKLDPDRQRRQLGPFAQRYRARRGGSEDLRPHPAATRNSSRDGLCGDRVRQAAWGQDAAEPGAGDAGARPREDSRRELSGSQRDRTRDPDRDARRHGRRNRGGGAQPDRQGHRDGDRDDGRAWRTAGYGIRYARTLRRSASPPSIPPAPATPSSAASRAITPPARTSEEALDKAVRYAANSVTRRGTQKAYATEGEFAAFCAGLPRGSP